MKVVYYTSTSYLDCALEIINVLKKHVDLHVLIEISPESKISTVIKVDSLPSDQVLMHPSELIGKEDYEHLDPYFKGTASTNFAVYAHRKSFSWATVSACKEIGKFLKKIQPNVIHFDGVPHRALGLIPYLKKIKIFFTIHDPLPHSGESNWRVKFAQLLYFKLSSGYFFYSKFAKKQFEKSNKKSRVAKFTLRMHPYSIFSRLLKDHTYNKRHILFFGRLSAYKGVDILLEATNIFLRDHPDETLVIAGSCYNGFNINVSEASKHKDQIIFQDRYIPPLELSTLIREAKFVICPYKEATQSGVLMTSFALGTPVIATNVGSFPEFIDDKINGFIIPPNDPLFLSNTISMALKDNFYKKLEVNIRKMYRSNEKQNCNSSILMSAYES